MIEHLYIHVPFCSSKCDYCAFYSETGFSRNSVAEYPDDLQRELVQLTREHRTVLPRTIYIGGGTPSLLGAKGFRRLAGVLRDNLDLQHLEEWSVELNPVSTSRALLQTMRAAGVNRVTFGAQSFDNGILRTLGRAHAGACTSVAVSMARDTGFNAIGIDLIAAPPGSDEAKWRVDIEATVALNPRHISVYALSIEPGTALAEKVAAGVTLPDEEEQLDRLRQAEETLAGYGFIRYEISNYARPGFECRHNLAIWKGGDYLGLGPSASSRIGVLRTENKASLTEWREALLGGRTPPRGREKLSVEDDALQRTLFRLRLEEGFNPAECARAYPVLASRLTAWERRLGQLRDLGITAHREGRWVLTGRGREICDSVIRELM